VVNLFSNVLTCSSTYIEEISSISSSLRVCLASDGEIFFNGIECSSTSASLDVGMASQDEIFGAVEVSSALAPLEVSLASGELFGKMDISSVLASLEVGLGSEGEHIEVFSSLALLKECTSSKMIFDMVGVSSSPEVCLASEEDLIFGEIESS